MADYTRYRFSVRAVIAALMLVIYTTGTTGIDLFHHLFHDHAAPPLHTEVSEQDPCHRFIYHQDKENGCNHKAHLTKAEKCKFSHVVFQSSQLLVHSAFTESSFADYSVPGYYYFCDSKTDCITQSLRGPPVA